MSTPADHHSSFARSLSSSIHLRQEARFVSNDDSGDSESSGSPLTRDHWGKVIRTESIPQLSITHSLSTNNLPSLSALPFSNDLYSRGRPAKKRFQRRADSKNLRRRAYDALEQPLSAYLSTESVDSRSGVEEQRFSDTYTLGETIRSTSDMIIEPTSEQAVQAVKSLQKYNSAFVKRSDGTYSYAIVVFRSDDSLAFVMCTGGSIKIISKKHWSASVVRLVSRDCTCIPLNIYYC